MFIHIHRSGEPDYIHGCTLPTLPPEAVNRKVFDIKINDNHMIPNAFATMRIEFTHTRCTPFLLALSEAEGSLSK